MCLGCTELVRNADLNRKQMDSLKEGFHSLSSVSSPSDTYSSRTVEGAKGYSNSNANDEPKPYDGENYFEKQRMIESNISNSSNYGNEDQASYSPNNTEYSIAA
jgi:hypothetical protein